MAEKWGVATVAEKVDRLHSQVEIMDQDIKDAVQVLYQRRSGRHNRSDRQHRGFRARRRGYHTAVCHGESE